ncbi:MAG: hypothetical protein QGF68_19915, partial [Nitrospinota bacterium]|nr:hypothetical protein [Nitrospinota bacterium]
MTLAVGFLMSPTGEGAFLMRIIPSAMASVLSFGVAFALAVDISSANPEAAAEIRTVLPLDAIPSIDNPTFVSAEKAKKFM